MPTLALLDRRAFLDWLGEETTPPARPLYNLSTLSADLRNSDLALIWDDVPNGPGSISNPVVVVADAKYRDFLAWATTYVSTYTPFTAFFRVIKTSDLDRFDLLGNRER